MELEPQPQTPFELRIDRRPRLEQPLPVRIIAVSDVSLPAQVGLEPRLDAFYTGLLHFVREPGAEVAGRTLAFRSESSVLHIHLQEGLVVREDYRPVLIEIPSLADCVHELIAREMEYTHQKAVATGQESLLLQDPAGNWIEIIEARPVR